MDLCSPNRISVGLWSSTPFVGSPSSRSRIHSLPRSFKQRNDAKSTFPNRKFHQKQAFGAESLVCHGTAQSILIGAGCFFTPGALFFLYAFIIGKGDFQHGLSLALSQISRGYFQPELGGPNVPICDGKFSDLMSDKPLFCFLYDWSFHLAFQKQIFSF